MQKAGKNIKKWFLTFQQYFKKNVPHHSSILNENAKYVSKMVAEQDMKILTVAH